jgi:hypothetical protein
MKDVMNLNRIVRMKIVRRFPRIRLNAKAKAIGRLLRIIIASPVRGKFVPGRIMPTVIYFKHAGKIRGFHAIMPIGGGATHIMAHA